MPTRSLLLFRSLLTAVVCGLLLAAPGVAQNSDREARLDAVREFERYFKKYKEEAMQVRAVMTLEGNECPEAAATLIDLLSHKEPGVRDAAVHTAVAELEAYTELDFGRGIEGLVSILVEGGEGGDEATRLLSGLGEEALALVAGAWPRLDEQGRRR